MVGGLLDATSGLDDAPLRALMGPALEGEAVESPPSVPERFPGRPLDAFSHVVRDRKEHGGPRCTLTSPLHPAWTQPGPRLPPGESLNSSVALERIRSGAARRTSAAHPAPLLRVALPQVATRSGPGGAIGPLQMDRGEGGYARLVWGLVGLGVVVLVAYYSTRRGFGLGLGRGGAGGREGRGRGGRGPERGVVSSGVGTSPVKMRARTPVGGMPESELSL